MTEINNLASLTEDQLYEIVNKILNSTENYSLLTEIDQELARREVKHIQ